MGLPQVQRAVILGDFDRDGVVSFPDFLLLAANFGETAAVAAVPEPSAVMLLVVGLAWFRRKRA